MYLESNFNNFKEQLLDISSKREIKEIKSAKQYSKKRILDGKKDSDEFFKSSILELNKELEELKKQKLLDIELKYIRKHHLLVKKHTYKIKHLLRSKLEDEFDYLSECFLVYINDTFTEGNILIFKDFDIDLEKFNIDYTEEKKIIFSEGKKYIEFSIDTILTEYDTIIKEKIAKHLGE